MVINMTKQEFIDRLRAALNGRIPTAKVSDTINYYEDYINTEIRKGRSEDEVLASLGDPRLIAKTIIQTSSDTDTTAQSAGYSRGNQESAYQNKGYQGDYGRYSDGGYNGMKTTRIPGWLLAIIVIIVVLIGISIIFSLLSFLAPLIIVMVAVLLMIKLFRDWLN